MKSTKKILITICAILAILIAGAAYLYFTSAPKFTYKLTASAVQDRQEQPLNIKKDGSKIDYSLLFISGLGDNHAAKLNDSLEFSNQFPFVSFSKNLEIRLINTDNQSQNMQVMYELNGSISNLKPGNYKLRVIDANNRLVDEKTF